MTTAIRHADFVDSIAAALQYISYYHPADYIEHLARAYAGEQSPAAKDAIAQILTNSKMSAEGRRPICQDTGIVNVFLKIGMDVRFEGFPGSVEDAVNEGVRKGYLDPDNTLRASVVADPQFERKNTKDNTPAVVHVSLVPGNTVDVQVAAKGGGSENKSKFVMLNPSDSVVDWVLKTVPTMGAGWCPPGMLGIGIGGTAEKAMLMAKESLMEPIDMFDLKQRGPKNKTEELRIELCDRINALGIGAQGLGGLDDGARREDRDVPDPCGEQAGGDDPELRRDAPRALRARRHPAPPHVEPPSLDLWPDVQWAPDYNKSKKVDLDTLTKEQVAAWKPGDTLLLSGKMLTGRDAAHKRIQDMLASRARSCRWTSPTASSTTSARSTRCATRWSAPPAPTTATRMDKFTEMMLAQTGLISMIGKAERGPVAIEAIRKHRKRLPDGSGRCGLPRRQGDQGEPRRRLRRPRHGSDLRVRREGHAGDGGRRFPRHQRARDRSEGVAGKDREDPGRDRLRRQAGQRRAAPKRPVDPLGGWPR